jgi:transglutaminase-like putative cysteine protease
MGRAIYWAAAWSAFALFSASMATAQNTPLVRHVDLTYTAEIPEVPAGAKILDLWIPVLSSNDRQSVKLLNESDLADGRITTEKKFGNRMFYRRFEAPFEPVRVQLRYVAEVREQTVPAAKQLAASRQTKPSAELTAYLGNLAMIPIAGRITQLANTIDLPKDEPLRAGRAIYDYLVDTMVYNYKAPGAGSGNAVWACDSKTGDCTDYHSVFIGVCRWRGIPADHVFGLPMPPEKPEGDIHYAHCWARFFVDGVGWIPIDASRADKFPEDREYYFGTLGSTWVTLSHGRDVVLEPPQQGQPENMFHGPVAEVDGQPLHGVKWVGHYKDRQQTAAK